MLPGKMTYPTDRIDLQDQAFGQIAPAPVIFHAREYCIRQQHIRYIRLFIAIPAIFFSFPILFYRDPFVSMV